MKLSDYKGEDALDLLADILEPATSILGDEVFREKMREKEPPVKLAKYALKNHKGAILEIMARIDGEDPATYKPGIFELPSKVLDILNDKELMDLFTSQAESVTTPAFGSVMENTEEKDA